MANIILLNEQTRSVNKLFLYAIIFSSALTIYADGENYNGQDVSGINLSESSLMNSSWIGTTAVGGIFKWTLFTYSDFTNADFREANFYHAKLQSVTFANTNFTGSIIEGANFYKSVETGFTKEHLYSTASYKNKNLNGIVLACNNLNGWNFSGQNLVGANFYDTILTNTNFLGANLSKAIFQYGIFSNTDFTDVNLSNANLEYEKFENVNLTNANLFGARIGVSYIYQTSNSKNINFTNANLTNVTFYGFGDMPTNINLTKSDLRGSNFIFETNGSYITKNTIMADGRIENFSMISADDNFSIRKYAPASEGGEMISAKINEAAAISGCAALTLENGAELEVLNAADLTVKNGSSIIINTDADSSTSFKVNSDGGLAFENGAILEINVVSDMSVRDTLQIVIMDFDDGARIAGLDALIKDETIQLSVNGSKWLGEWDYALENNQMLITVAVPEPAVCAAAIGALSLLLAVRRRMR